MPSSDRASSFGRALTVGAAVVFASTLALVSTMAQDRRAPTVAKASAQWEDYGGGPDSSKFFDLTQITPQNVSGLTVAELRSRSFAKILDGRRQTQQS